MSGLLLLLVLGAWGASLYFASYYLTFFIQAKRTRVLISITTMVLLFAVPVWDEIKGRTEFEALCKTGGVYQISPNAVGKKFDLKYSSSEHTNVSGQIRPVVEHTIFYTDVVTGAVVVTGKAYSAGGGWLVRAIGVNPTSGGTGPLIGRFQCFPDDSVEQARRLNAVINKVIN